jgi:hypothetical protein
MNLMFAKFGDEQDIRKLRSDLNRFIPTETLISVVRDLYEYGILEDSNWGFKLSCWVYGRQITVDRMFAAAGKQLPAEAKRLWETTLSQFHKLQESEFELFKAILVKNGYVPTEEE